MTEYELTKNIIQTALKGSSCCESKILRVSLKTGKYVRLLKSLGKFSDAELHDELSTLQQSTPWLFDLQPKDQDSVANIQELKFKLNLEYWEKMKIYSGYVPDPAKELKDQWLKLVSIENSKLAEFNFQRWGDSPILALKNIQDSTRLLESEELSQHQLSAIFTNNAKRLTGKDINDLLSVYPDLTLRIRPRKVILNYYAQDFPELCLIVENMDTYHYLQGKLPGSWMLVCGFGYRVTKSDISNLKIIDLHASIEVQDKIKFACNKFWLDTEGKKLYWGDLDDEGNQIFESLKKQYPTLKKWKPAYDAMEARKKQAATGLQDIHQEAILMKDINFEEDIH